MNLLVLMYHRARAGRLGNSPEMLELHLSYVARSYATVLPGDALATDRLNVCLSFDDGYFDFYAVVFPLLKKYNLRALLAVAPAVVPEQATLPYDARLNAGSEEAFNDPATFGFCTWPELDEMSRSGHVALAAHSFSHHRLDPLDADLALEIDRPKEILQARLGQPVDSFVFPFGRFSSLALERARKHYRHIFRIGGAMNHSWSQRVLYRIDADDMEGPRSLFSPARLAAYRARYLWNRLRGR